MPAPYDYTVKSTAIDPGQFGVGVQAGRGLLDARAEGQQFDQQATAFAQAQVAAQAQSQAAQAAAAKKAADEKQMREDISTEMSNSTMEGMRGLMVKYPELSKPYEPILASLTAQEKQNEAIAAAEMYAAITNEKPEIAAQLADERAELLSQNPVKGKQAEAMRKLAEGIRRDPNTAKFGLASAIANIGGKEMIEGITKIEILASERKQAEAKTEQEQAKARFAFEQELGKVEKNTAEVADLYSKISERAKRLDLDERELLRKTSADRSALGELPAGIGKEVSEDVASANTNDATATRLRELASSLRKAKKKAGVLGTFANTGLTGKGVAAANDVFALQGDFTDVQKQYLDVQEKAIAADLKGQGQTTEAERDAFRKGWLNKSSDPDVLAADIERRAAILEREAQSRRGLSEYRAKNKSNGNVRESFSTSDGFEVKPGTSQADFSKQYTGFIAGKEAAKKPPQKAPAEMTPEERAARRAEIQAELAKGAP